MPIFQLAEYVDSAHHGQRRSIIMMSAPGSTFSPYHLALVRTEGSITANKIDVSILAGSPAIVFAFLRMKLFAEWCSR
tara:strand:+ start:538 stop:771 length:234 start_codon:yes stop_codon:yes gene_type:complete